MPGEEISKVRTRIAPSPTGDDIHIGNLYTALINFVFAKKNNGQFIVRIEDTDRTRYVEGSEERILSSLKAFGITHDEGPDKGGPYAPYRQSQRKELYKKYAEELIKKGRAYYCFCSRERLDQIRKAQVEKKQLPRYDKYCLTQVKNAEDRIKNGELYVIRLNVLPNKKVWFKDVIRGKIEFDSNQIDDQVLLKSDRFPTYHLGVVVDDYIMKISHVIRAEEWISSTPKHVILYESFGWELPVFAHVPILRNPDKSKLSKRKNPVWASWYLKEGFLPEAVLNFLALMGWSHPKEKEIFSFKEFIQLFELQDIKPVGPVFDLEKLKWMNGMYIRQLSIDELGLRLKVHSSKFSELDEGKLKKLAQLAQERIKTLNEFYDLVKWIIEDVEVELDDTEKEIAKTLLEKCTMLQLWNEDSILLIMKEIMNQYNIKMSALYKIFTGSEKGLPLPKSLEIIGKKEVLLRLDTVVKV